MDLDILLIDYSSVELMSLTVNTGPGVVATIAATASLAAMAATRGVSLTVPAAVALKVLRPCGRGRIRGRRHLRLQVGRQKVRVQVLIRRRRESRRGPAPLFSAKMSATCSGSTHLRSAPKTCNVSHDGDHDHYVGQTHGTGGLLPSVPLFSLILSRIRNM